MLKLLQKIFDVGVVTEAFDGAATPERFRGRLEVERQGCRDCRQCVEACPVNAIQKQNGDIALDTRACLFCGRCVEVCERHQLRHTNEYKLAALGDSLQEELGTALLRRTRKLLRRSLQIRHVDAGSCNACDFEMNALSNPFYDLQQYGIDFVASPRHADMLMVTGVVTRNLTQALMMTYEAVPAPKLVMAVGACAATGKTYGESYAIRGGADAVVPVDIYVPGCPPRPAALLYALLLALDRLPR
ncbi:MAG TPA: NADH-quinone oxidoreductase subunit NuoB [Patescibacteria group bacterium]|nr:NADH-quinone oxidoreductase subunit NuoB [Patescibacteria group bacterium]